MPMAPGSALRAAGMTLERVARPRLFLCRHPGQGAAATRGLFVPRALAATRRTVVWPVLRSPSLRPPGRASRDPGPASRGRMRCAPEPSDRRRGSPVPGRGCALPGMTNGTGGARRGEGCPSSPHGQPATKKGAARLRRPSVSQRCGAGWPVAARKAGPLRRYSAAARKDGAAARIAPSTWLSNLAKLLTNMSTSLAACAS